MRPLIILFAKAPVPGRVKTRLGLPPEAAAALHTAFVHDMLETLASLDDTADIELSTDSETDAWNDVAAARSVQTAGDLGARMYAALERALETGRPRVMILGSDAPTLPAAHVRTLLRSAAEVALGPADDGGYYGIACRKIHAAMFRRVAWSTASALKDTVRAARNCGLSTELGPAWFDIDEPVDLVRLRASPLLPRHTAECLRANLMGQR